MQRSHLLAVSARRNRRSIELVHRGLQPLLKVGPNLPFLCKNEPYNGQPDTLQRVCLGRAVHFRPKQTRCNTPVILALGG